MREFIVLGSMSGTSKDGHDVAKLRIVTNDGGELEEIEWLASETYPYSAEQRELLCEIERLSSQSGRFLDCATVAVAPLEMTNGALPAPTPLEMTGVLSPLDGKSCEPSQSGDVSNSSPRLGHVSHLSPRLGDASHLSSRLSEANGEISSWFISDFERFLKQYPNPVPELIGLHGQTVYHNPAEGITLQLGDGEAIAKALGIPVVYDLRKKDVENGGQGAPLAGMLHHALAMQSFKDQLPVAVVNIGGIANVSLITGADPASVIAFDTGPGNTLLNQYTQRFLNCEMDRDGRYGLQGSVDDVEVARLAKAVFKDTDYFSKAPPKSLDVNGLQLLDEINQRSPEDACAMYASIAAYCIARALKFDGEMTACVLSGGGSRNPVIVQQLKKYLRCHLDQDQRSRGEISVLIADDIPGWENDALEAGLFAYLAVRRVMNLPTSYPAMTGVSKPVVAGVYVEVI